MEKKWFVHDIEIFPNLFLVIFLNFETKELQIFEISPRIDQRFELFEFLKKIGVLVGFNSLSFDYPIIHYFVRLLQRNLLGNQLVDLLYKKGQELINSSGNRWKNIVRSPFMEQKDLFLINHYDNFAKSTSLKVLEFNMQMLTIQDLPFKFDTILKPDEINKVIGYCINDVNATEQFLVHNMDAINFRTRMSKLYNHDFGNYNDVKIGEQILLKAVSEGMKMDTWEVKKMRTLRTSMSMEEIIFNYVNFKTTEFNTLLDWWRDKNIIETKGQFTKLPMESVTELLPYCNPKTEKGKLKNLNIILNNFQFDFGTGGLHGASRAGVWKSDDEYDITLIDVSSYYPNLAYYNKLHPQHIPVEIFMDVIHMLYSQRMKAKDEGDNEMVKAIKLALNGALYGKSNSEYSFLYDPQFMMSICVNGQLLLSMLAEQCILHGFELIQVNTDGVMIRLKKSQRPYLDNITKQWMKLTGLKLDYDHFDTIVQKDVNNYLGRYVNGKIKYKGAFDYNYEKNGDWHKNFSMLIVPKALEAYFLNGIAPDEFMRNTDDLYGFFKRTKYNKTTKLIERVYDENENITEQKVLQNITRYYVSTTGKKFVKIMPPLAGKIDDREFAVESGYLCKEMNQVTPEKVKQMKEDIDYEYYISKATDVIKLIEDV